MTFRCSNVLLRAMRGVHIIGKTWLWNSLHVFWSLTEGFWKAVEYSSVFFGSCTAIFESVYELYMYKDRNDGTVWQDYTRSSRLPVHRSCRSTNPTWRAQFTMTLFLLPKTSSWDHFRSCSACCEWKRNRNKATNGRELQSWWHH